MSTNEKNITRGGEFIIKETDCENIFSPEDFSEEQLMMKQAVSDFIDKEVMPHRERFENKDSKIFVKEDSGILVGFVQLYPIFSSTKMQR